MVESTDVMEKSSVQDATAWEPAGVCSKNGATIYVVDDEPMVGELVATVLEMEGFQIKLFTHPVEALKAFIIANPRPALLLTDFMMADLNGMELIDHCNRAHPTLKTILYSAHIGADVIQRYSVKPDLFIRKPLDPTDLVDAVRSVMVG